MKLAIRPLTPEMWPALDDLFGKAGACNRCWCMYGRIGAAYRKRPREESRRDFRKVVETGPPRGLLAFDAAVSLSASGTGYASTFARLGFKVVARHVPARPIMRHDLKAITPASPAG